MLLATLSRSELTARLRQRPLLGYAAHLAMEPALRRTAMQALPTPAPAHKEAAVLCLIYPHEGVWKVVLIIRPEYDGAHSGQIAFPGGGVETVDHDFEATALRETYEEVGVAAETIEVVRALTPLYIPVSHFWVYPFVGIAAERPAFVLDPVEVAGIVEVPLSVFTDPDRRSTTDISLDSGKQRLCDVPYFVLDGGYVLWGATAMMLGEVAALVE